MQQWRGEGQHNHCMPTAGEACNARLDWHTDFNSIAGAGIAPRCTRMAKELRAPFIMMDRLT